MKFFKALVLGTAGTSPFVVPAGYFKLADPDETIESSEVSLVERTVETRIGVGSPLGVSTNDGITGTTLRIYPVRVRIGYQLILTAGLDFDATGQQSGSADREAIEDRAETDRQLLTSVLTSHANWNGLSPRVIHFREQQVTQTLDFLTDRAVLQINFELLARLSVPGSYGPSLTGS